jgi:exopolysaccharide biosynthesis polyprenyl glycosylphosphotransferase
VSTFRRQRLDQVGLVQPTVNSPNLPMSPGRAAASGQAPIEDQSGDSKTDEDPCQRSYSLFRRQGPWKDALRRRMLLLADVVAVAIGVVALTLVTGSGRAALGVLLLLPVWIVVAKAQGLYDDHIKLYHVTSDELPRLLYWSTISATIVLLIGEAVQSGPLHIGHVSMAAALALWGTALACVVMTRSLARAAWSTLVGYEHALLVGRGPVADAVVRKLALVASRETNVSSFVGTQDTGRELVGDPRLASLLEGGSVDRIILALPDLDEATLAHAVALCRRTRVKLSVAPPLRAMFGTAVRLTRLAELSLIEFHSADIPRTTLWSKRVIDVAGAMVGLLLVSPAFVIVGLAVKLDSRGPIFFTQMRAGRDGHPFRMIKFRTMVAGAEQMLAGVVQLDELTEPAFKVRNDPRVTRIGRVLRRSSLDETPQLVNVLLGQMSLVGPRPEELAVVKLYTDDDRIRLQVRPGITGPMQVYGRGELSFTERLAVEREYIENYSLQKDVKILLRTFPVVSRATGAF